MPLLAGWNADEIRSSVTLAPVKPTVASFTEQTRQAVRPGGRRDSEGYAPTTDAEAIEVGGGAGQRHLHRLRDLEVDPGARRHAKAPVYRYSFDRKIPIPPDTKVNGVAATAADIGARHAGEIEYVFGQLDTVPKVTWEAETARCRTR